MVLNDERRAEVEPGGSAVAEGSSDSAGMPRDEVDGRKRRT